MIDDSALLVHRAEYDPAKAHAYYLRTRRLKGREKTDKYDEGKGENYYRQVGRLLGNEANDGMRPSRRKELEAQRAALEKRLDALRASLSKLVEQAQRRSGVDKKPEPEKAAPTTTTKEKTKKTEKSSEKSSDKPLTESQKRDKREASREQYQKEKGMGLSQDVQQLQVQIKDIRAKIEKAVADAREKSSESKSQTASKGR